MAWAETGGSFSLDPASLRELGGRYGLEMDPGSVFRLCEEHGLDHPMLHMGP